VGSNDVERVIKAGFNRHLAKPVNLETLQDVLIRIEGCKREVI
jgi:hypothetical protein